jgi:ribosomal protein L11 methyltransferase
VALDFDPEAIRTAHRNERLNFRVPMIDWRQTDVKKLRAKRGYDLMLANLFSGILCAAAEVITGAVAPGGELWMSGILRPQRQEVVDAYEKRGWQLLRAVRRGKWIMLQWRRPHAGTGALKKTVQTK